MNKNTFTTLKHSYIKTLVIFLVLQLIGINCVLFSLYIGIVIYSIGFISTLLWYIFGIKHNKLSLLFSGGIFLYFYQVPFILLFENDASLYSVSLSPNELMIFFGLYSLVALLYLPLILIVRNINIRNMIIPWNQFTKFIYWICLSCSILLAFYGVYNAGGINSYLLLNKFEVSEIQGFAYLSYKPFYLIMLPIGLSCKNKLINYITFFIILIAIIFDTISAKRFILLASCICIYIYRFNIHKLSIKSFFIGIFMFIFFVIVKKTYYPLAQFIIGNISANEIFWFTKEDFLNSLLINGECNGHILLTANYIFYGINFFNSNAPNILYQLLAMIPFAGEFNKYTSAGEFMRIYVNEPWAGLASSQYIVGYLSLSYIGIIFSFLILICLFYLYKIMISSKKIIPKIMASSYSPIFLFYLHREELMVFKSMFTAHLFILIAITILFFITTNLLKI